ncbi:MAG: tetratricopeptide repeat protein [Acidobacteriota bacterium]
MDYQDQPPIDNNESADFDPIDIEPIEKDNNGVPTVYEVNQTLAEVSFLEGHECVARKNRSGALTHYRTAVSYAPNRIEFYLKLIEVLAEDASTRAEAFQLLTKAIEIAPNNPELRAKLAELRNAQDRPRPEPKTTNRITRPLINEPIRLRTGELSNQNATARMASDDYEASEILKAIVELENNPNTTPIHETKRRTRSLHSGNLEFIQENQDFVVSPDKQSSRKFSRRHWIVFSLAFIAVIAGIGYRIFSQAQIRLLSPAKDISAQQLEFSWQCDKAVTSFVIEVYDKDQLVLRQITDKTSYSPDINQKLIFQAEHTYHWLVLPNPDVEQKYYFKSIAQTFHITSAMTPVAAAPVTPIEEATPSRKIEPSATSAPSSVRSTPKLDSRAEEVPLL